MVGESRLWVLDLARGLSALAVCAGHLRAAMFVDYGHAETGGLFQSAFYFLTAMGHEAVMIFFVLSGFFVGGRVVSKGAEFDFYSYCIARLTRLWVVLIPVLVITWLVDALTAWVAADVLAGEHRTVLNSGPDGEYSTALYVGLGNLFFLQTIHVPVWGSNGPLWSLANEFWYYLFFPLLWLVMRPHGFQADKAKRLLALVACVVVWLLALRFLVDGFLVWLLGVLLIFLPVINISVLQRQLLGAVATILFASVLASTVANVLPAQMLRLSDYLLAVGFVCMIWAWGWHEASQQPSGFKLIKRMAKWLADCSYSLYLVHFPFVLLFYAAATRGAQWNLNTQSLLIYLAVLLLLVMVGRATYLLFEQHTDKVRDVVFAWLDEFAPKKIKP